MEVHNKYIEPIINGLGAYLNGFKVGGNSLPFNVEGTTTEANDTTYPYFYLRSFWFYPNTGARQSGTKYVYEVDEQAKSAQKKERPQPYILECVLELVGRNPINFYHIYELLEQKRQRDKVLEVVMESGTVLELPITWNPPRPNNASAILHVFWTAQINVLVDPSMAVSITDVVETINQTGEVYE